MLVGVGQTADFGLHHTDEWLQFEIVLRRQDRGERRRKGSIFVSTNAHQIPKLAGRILALYDVHVGIAFVLQAVRQSIGILFDFERAN